MQEFEPPGIAGKIGEKRDNIFVARGAKIVHIRIDVCYSSMFVRFTRKVLCACFCTEGGP